MLGSKISSVSEKYGFVPSFMHLKLWREGEKGRRTKVGEARWGLEMVLSRVNTPLEGSFCCCIKGTLTYMHRTDGQGQLKAKTSLSLKKLCAWGVTTHHDLRSLEFMSRSPWEVTFHNPPFFCPQPSIQTHWPCFSHPRAFALAVPSAWHGLRPQVADVTSLSPSLRAAPPLPPPPWALQDFCW